MENTVTNMFVGTFLGTEEQHLVDYLENQISNTSGFIKRTENSIDVLKGVDDVFATSVQEVIGEKMEEIICYRFRLDWLQKQRDSINDDSFIKWMNTEV